MTLEEEDLSELATGGWRIGGLLALLVCVCVFITTQELMWTNIIGYST
jgi:hypothetical protein